MLSQTRRASDRWEPSRVRRRTWITFIFIVVLTAFTTWVVIPNGPDPGRFKDNHPVGASTSS